MITLFIDSSRKSLSVALASQNKLLFVSNVNSYSKHSNFLMNEITNVLKKTELTILDVDNIIVLNGPGSFTGIRVGVTIAKTLAWALNKKLYVLSNLKALSLGANEDVVISVIPDKDDYSYVGIYENDNVKEDYFYIKDDAFNITNKKIIIRTMDENNFANALKSKLSINNNVSLQIVNDYDYLNLISYALSLKDINSHLAKPIYLKKIDAEKIGNK
mgnify:CR=1 FL=1